MIHDNLTLVIHVKCGNGGCLIELAQQLAVIMIGEITLTYPSMIITTSTFQGKQIINNAKEMLIPMLKAWWHRKKVNVN